MYNEAWRSTSLWNYIWSSTVFFFPSLFIISRSTNYFVFALFRSRLPLDQCLNSLGVAQKQFRLKMVERGNFWKMVTLWVSVALAKRMVAALDLVNARGEREFSKHNQAFIVSNLLYLIHFYSIGNCCQRKSSHLPRSMDTIWYGSKVGSYITLPLAVKLFIFQTKKYTAAFLRRRISRQRVRHRACIWINNNFSKQKTKNECILINWLTHQYFLDPMTNSVFADRAWREERSTWCPLEVRYHRLHLPK